MGRRAKTLGGGKKSYRRTFTTREQGDKYKEAQRFYASKAWRRLREEKLRKSPLCAECLLIDRIEPAVDFDHVLPRDERPDLELDWDNIRGLCKRCHTIKTRRDHAS